MVILVTGAAGFIGFHLVKSLLTDGHEVIGIDNLNSYYELKLKLDRLNHLGIEYLDDFENDLYIRSSNSNFIFAKIDTTNKIHISELFERYKFNIIIHLAAQAGVRYSLENPDLYIQSNIVGFFNLIDGAKKSGIQRFIYASSSSVYGQSEKIILSETDNVDNPVSLYAASKKSNELLAHVYSSLYNIETIGLRFFTVYGPWGRPDMAPFLFTNSIIQGKPIDVFNHGFLKRDFTYIDDIILGIKSILNSKLEKRYNIFNIGNSSPVELLDFIKHLEDELKCKAKINFKEMQLGDVYSTFANIDALSKLTGYKPKTSIKEGVAKFIFWYINYYK